MSSSEPSHGAGSTGGWQRLGRVFEPDGYLQPWWRSHAALPTVLPHDGSQRVYVSGRDEQSRAHVGHLDLDLAGGGRVLAVSQTPDLGLGPLGAFDDNGVTVSCVTQHAGRLYLYYTGWTLGVTVPFFFYIGLAISEDGGQTFTRASLAPVLGRTSVDPYLTASPWVLVEGSIWRMWYVSADRWTIEAGQPKHYYHIRYAESPDGIVWTPTGRVCVDFASPDEYAFGRPCVVKDPDLYRMWYCVRGDRYRVGYAESTDGLAWERRDPVGGLDCSADGWDAEMTAYPCVADVDGRRYLLYNGNGYGKSGVGLAVWTEGSQPDRDGQP